MLGVFAVVVVGGLLAALTVGGESEELEDAGAPSPEELEEDDGVLPLPPVPTAEDAPPPNYRVLRDPAEFGDVQDAIEGNGGQPSTLYAGMAADWAGRIETVRELADLARQHPELNVHVFAFELTRELFGLPDSYLAHAVTAVNPSGRVFDKVLTADRRSAGPVSSGRLAELAAFALGGFELPDGGELFVKRKPGDIDHTIAVWPDDGLWRWMFWRGGTVGTEASARGSGRAGTKVGAQANARAAVVAYKLGHAAGVPLGFG